MHASVIHASRQAGRQAGRQVVDEERNNKTKSKAMQGAGCGGAAKSLQTPHHPSSTALVRVDVQTARPITIAIVVVSIIGKAGRKR